MILENVRVRAGGGTVRAGIALSAALLVTACNQTAASMLGAANAPEVTLQDSSEVNPKYRRQRVAFATQQPPGTVVVDPGAKFLYLVMSDGTALRYGIGVGREGFGWSGTAEIGRKARWPRWTPPAEMIRRQPELERYRKGMEPGLNNPLGARALYLYQDGRDTLYRIHGTEESWSIGRNVSSGCIRLLNQDVIDLFARIPIGARVVVLPAKPADETAAGSEWERR
jgi:lipoprotein-anchoring transpeptidase ErfK/SrfK